MKIRAQSKYQTIFDSNENQSIGCYVVITYITHIGVVRNQWGKQGSAIKQYVVITNIMQIVLIRKEKASNY